MPTHYILLRDHVAIERNQRLGPSYQSDRNVQALKGSLWKCENDILEYYPHSKNLQLTAIGDNDGVYMTCADNDVSRLTEQQCALLTPITTCGDRYKVFQDKSWLTEAVQIKCGTVVFVLKLESPSLKIVGKVQYRGSVPNSSGVLFGVELSEEFAGKGTSDGVFRKQRYFQCETDCAVFVSINKLRICTKPKLFNKKGSVNEESPINSPVEHEVNFDDRSLSPPPLEIGERVVWIGDQGPHYGTVHWIGILDDSKEKEWTVGVEFDDPVGTGTGKYQDTQLFKARAKHASLIPMIGLIKASEFGGDPAENGTGHENRGYIKGYDSSPENTLKGTSTARQKAGVVLDQEYYIQSYKTDRRLTPDIPPKSRREPQERAFYDEIGARTDYENVVHGGMSKASSTYEKFLDDPKDDNYARVNEWLPNINSRAPSSSSHSPQSAHMSPPLPPIRSVHDHRPKACQTEVVYAQIHRPENAKSTYSETYLSDIRNHQDYPSSRPPAYNELSDNYEPAIDYTDSKVANANSTRTRTTKSFIPHNIASDSDNKNFLLKQEPNSALSNRSNAPIMHEDRSDASHQYEQISNDVTKPREYPKAQAIDPKDIGSDMEIGSMVEVVDNPPNCRYGVIKWIGYLLDKTQPIAGLEMEEESASCTFGNFGGQQIFDCQAKKAFFVYLHKVKRDSRFEESVSLIHRTPSLAFGSLECPDVTEITAPQRLVTNTRPYLGKQKGIQGHHNSCYLDATLFSMFAFSSIFDSILLRDSTPDDIREFKDVQIVMRTGIVYPLRRNFYVRADKVLKLRTLLDKVTNITGLMTEEKDPEEFLTCLFQDVLKVEPFFKLNSNQASFLYQLFVEKDEKIILPTTEQLLELSFYQSNIKLTEVPSCLILQMPRFGKEYKMYDKILPSLELDITDLLEYGPRECYQCGKLARYECRECFELTQFSLKDGLKSDGLLRCAFCDGCARQFHQHRMRQNHKYTALERNTEYEAYCEKMQKLGYKLSDEPMPREKMELFAVICIETSHYVAFVKCGAGKTAPWVFFDSMADRKGEQNGYNIPEVKPCAFLPDLLLDDKKYNYLCHIKDNKLLDPYERRLLCDAYICMYQSTDMQMYT